MYNSYRDTIRCVYHVVVNEGGSVVDLGVFPTLAEAYDFISGLEWTKYFEPIPTYDLDYYPNIVVDAFRDGETVVTIERDEVYIDYKKYDYTRYEYDYNYKRNYGASDVMYDPIEDYWDEVEEKRYYDRIFADTQSMLRNYLPWAISLENRKEPLVLTRNKWYIGVSKILLSIGDDRALYQKRSP